MHPLVVVRHGLIKQLGASVTWLPLPGGLSFGPLALEERTSSSSCRHGRSGPKCRRASSRQAIHAAAHILEPPCVGDSQANLSHTALSPSSLINKVCIGIDHGSTPFCQWTAQRWDGIPQGALTMRLDRRHLCPFA
jgi:hypothetical protein